MAYICTNELRYLGALGYTWLLCPILSFLPIVLLPLSVRGNFEIASAAGKFYTVFYAIDSLHCDLMVLFPLPRIRMAKIKNL